MQTSRYHLKQNKTLLCRNLIGKKEQEFGDELKLSCIIRISLKKMLINQLRELINIYNATQKKIVYFFAN